MSGYGIWKHFAAIATALLKKGEYRASFSDVNLAQC